MIVVLLDASMCNKGKIHNFNCFGQLKLSIYNAAHHIVSLGHISTLITESLALH